MSQDFVQDTQLQVGSVGVFRSLLETLVLCFNGDSLCDDILKEVHESVVNETNKWKLVDLLASDIYIYNLFNYLIMGLFNY